MLTPSWVTFENVKHNGTLDNAVVLNNAAGIKTLILWDALSAEDKALLTDRITAQGGTTPLAAATSGYQAATFTAAVAGSDATGLSVATATAGTATINLGGVATAGTTSGLSVTGNTAGSQLINFSPLTTTTSPTGSVAATSGHQTAQFTTPATAPGATGLANDTTVYTTTITVDGTAIPVSVTGSAAQTFADLLTVINTALGAAGTAAIVSGNIVITSASAGTGSTVLAVTGTLFTALTGFTAIQATVQGTGSTVPLTATVTINGTPHTVSVVPGSATTFAGIVSAISTAIGATGTATMVGPDIVVTSATTGSTSTVSIADTTLFRSLPGFVAVEPARGGVNESRTYSAIVVVDGTTIKSINTNGVQGDTMQHVVDAINADLGISATAAITGGNIVITSATTGRTSSVDISDSGFICASLTGYAGISRAVGTSSRTYTATITVGLTVIPVSVVGSSTATITDLVTAINTALGVTATAAISSNTIAITSAATGVNSKVVITDGDLFHSLARFAGFGESVSGATDMVSVFKATRTPKGNTMYENFDILFVGVKPAVPPHCTHTTSFIYFDGTVWKYLDDDTTV